MEQKVIEIARGVAKTSTFATKNEALRFAKSEGGAAIGIYENGGMYMFAFGAYKPQMVYSKLVYELKKSYNTGVHRTYNTDDGVFVAYMPLRKKMRRHGHGSPVPPPPPPSIDIVFIGDENAALLGDESDLMWREEQKSLGAAVFVKSTAYDKIAESVMEIDGAQIVVSESNKKTIAEIKEVVPSVIIPQGFGDGDYLISYTTDNVEDITEGDKAKVVLIDSEGEEFAETNEKEIHIIPVPQVDYLSFTGEAENAKLLMSVYSEAEEPEMPDIEYSSDKVNWHQVAFTKAEGEDPIYYSPEFTLDVDETIYFKGDNPNGLATDERGFAFVIDEGDVSSSGDVGTLTDGVGGHDVVLTADCYEYMFIGCTSLTSAPALPATTLAEGCYGSMFSDCTSLTSAPALPATTLAEGCYSAMFSNCTSLTSAPALPATTLADYCYSYMFDGCTSLTSAPALPATTLADYCYQNMFDGCTSLTSAPALPATTLAEGCYENMFSGCASLTSAPALPATTLADYCYQFMFSECAFDMSDDGTTFNFEFGATLPQTVGEETYSTHKDVAEWMENTNGFNE